MGPGRARGGHAVAGTAGAPGGRAVNRADRRPAGDRPPDPHAPRSRLHLPRDRRLCPRAPAGHRRGGAAHRAPDRTPDAHARNGKGNRHRPREDRRADRVGHGDSRAQQHRQPLDDRGERRPRPPRRDRVVAAGSGRPGSAADGAGRERRRGAPLAVGLRARPAPRPRGRRDDAHRPPGQAPAGADLCRPRPDRIVRRRRAAGPGQRDPAADARRPGRTGERAHQRPPGAGDVWPSGGGRQGRRPARRPDLQRPGGGGQGGGAVGRTGRRGATVAHRPGREGNLRAAAGGAPRAGTDQRRFVPCALGSLDGESPLAGAGGGRGGLGMGRPGSRRVASRLHGRPGRPGRRRRACKGGSRRCRVPIPSCSPPRGAC